MVKKTGLGKGLDALFSMPVAEEEQKQENDILKNLSLNEIEPNREQARKVFDEDALSDLAESIKMYGVIQPIVVTKKDDYYSIIAGERRWRAAKTFSGASASLPRQRILPASPGPSPGALPAWSPWS